MAKLNHALKVAEKQRNDSTVIELSRYHDRFTYALNDKTATTLDRVTLNSTRETQREASSRPAVDKLRYGTSAKRPHTARFPNLRQLAACSDRCSSQSECLHEQLLSPTVSSFEDLQEPSSSYNDDPLTPVYLLSMDRLSPMNGTEALAA